MTKREAETKLDEHHGDCFLTRYSNAASLYRLSVKKAGKNGDGDIFQHFNITITPSSDDTSAYEIEGADYEFDSFTDLLIFYQTYPINNTVGTLGDSLDIEDIDAPMPKRGKKNKPKFRHKV